MFTTSRGGIINASLSVRVDFLKSLFRIIFISRYSKVHPLTIRDLTYYRNVTVGVICSKTANISIAIKSVDYDLILLTETRLTDNI